MGQGAHSWSKSSSKCSSCWTPDSSVAAVDLSTSDGGPPAAAPEPLPTPMLVGACMPASSARASDSGPSGKSNRHEREG